MAQPNLITALIVEHEAIVQLELVDWLAGKGVTALAASNADEAIAMLNNHRAIQLILTDIKMPGSMDGLRLAHHIRDRWPPVKIVVMSGMAETRPRDLPKGGIFLPKPFKHDVLWDIITRLTERAPAGRAA